MRGSGEMTSLVRTKTTNASPDLLSDKSICPKRGIFGANNAEKKH